MKSMTGFRRFVSDYGFEGIFQKRNIESFSNGLLYLIGTSAAAFSLAVYMHKCGEPLSYQKLAKSVMVSAPENCGTAPKAVPQALLSSLMKANISVSNLQLAANRLAPIESRIFEIASFISALQRAMTDQPGVPLLQLSGTLVCPPLGVQVREIIDTTLPDSKSLDELETRMYDQLVSNWLKAGYFDDETYPNRRVFGNRQSSEAVSVDIGSKIRSSLGFGPSYDAYASPVRGVEQWGFALIKSAITRSELKNLKQSLKLDEDSASGIGERIVEMDKNISHSRALPNRLQLLIRGSALEPLFEGLHPEIVPVITGLMDRKKSAAERVILSDIRLIVVDYAASKGNWTLMNSRGGYTAIIPLYDRDCISGSQLLLPGSHFLADRSLSFHKKVWLALQRYSLVKRPIAVTDLYDDGCWRAGDALILDNRLLHCSQENKRFKSGTYLLMKYETLQEAPVGMYLSGKLTYRLANLLERASRLALPIP